MHKNQIWLAFLLTTTLIVFWFSTITGYDLYYYFTRTSSNLPNTIEWAIKGKASDRYYLSATYQYTVGESLYDGKTAIESTSYRNIRAAEIALSEQKKKNLKIWHSPQNPENSTINNIFPLKSCFYTGLLWGLLLYFVWLGFYVNKFKVETFSKD